MHSRNKTQESESNHTHSHTHAHNLLAEIVSTTISASHTFCALRTRNFANSCRLPTHVAYCALLVFSAAPISATDKLGGYSVRCSRVTHITVYGPSHNMTIDRKLDERDTTLASATKRGGDFCSLRAIDDIRFGFKCCVCV